MPLVCSRDYHVLPKLSQRLNLSPAQLLSFLVLLIVLVIQLLREPVIFPQEPQLTSKHTAKADWFTPANTNIFHQPLPVSRPQKMTLLEEAKRVASEFEYSAEDVRRGVEAFISQMRTMSRKNKFPSATSLIYF